MGIRREELEEIREEVREVVEMRVNKARESRGIRWRRNEGRKIKMSEN